MRHLISSVLLLCICNLAIAQKRELTPEQKEAQKRFELAKQNFVDGEYTAVAQYYEALMQKQSSTRFETYKMAYESYTKLAATHPEDSTSYISAAQEIYQEAVKWHGKMYTEEKWSSLKIGPNSKAEIFAMVDEKPAFPGGDAAMYKYLGQSIDYPKQARKLGIEGRIFVQFIVNKDGSIDAVHVLKGIGAGCDEEALRVVSGFPKWTPGKIDGEPVYVRMVLPVFFKLAGPPSKKKKKKRRHSKN